MNIKSENKFEKRLRNFVTVFLTFMFVFETFSQNLVLTESYNTNEVNDWPMHKIHTSTFSSLDQAIEYHKLVLDMNGVDTTYTIVELELDVPVFSSFLAEDNETAIVTYIKKNYFGNYMSVFIECDNVTFDLFESDGFMLTHKKIK